MAPASDPSPSSDRPCKLPPAKLPRLQLAELMDQPWLPEFLRRGEAEYLETVLTLSRGFAPLAPILTELSSEASEPRIIDLCSGGAGPYLHLQEAVARHAGRSIPVVLTDLYPNPEAYARAEAATGGLVTGRREPVDARSVPRTLGGVRTLFEGLHHFRPAEARAILADAAAAREPILVGELTTRRFSSLVGMLVLVPLLVLMLTPLVRPLRLSRLFFTYVIPILPLIIWFDGLVSTLRTYRPAELRALVDGLDDGYRWEIGTTRDRGGTITWLVGRPVVAEAETSDE
jgi:hypothetical protein